MDDSRDLGRQDGVGVAIESRTVSETETGIAVATEIVASTDQTKGTVKRVILSWKLEH